MEDNCNTEGQIRITMELMKEYGIREGTKIQILEVPAGLILRPIHRIENWAGADAKKYSHAEMVEELDNSQERMAKQGLTDTIAKILSGKNSSASSSLALEGCKARNC